MATITKAAKVTDSDLSGDATPEVAVPEAKAADSIESTNEVVSQTLRLLRFKLSTLQADARRKRPFMSATQEEARGKLNAAVTVLREFSEQSL